ncbi:MAG: beta-lactamase family protein [Oscillospiraceae bacterium]|nr:beta-lactamase family protein [Oscillospiraceae bacterium]
MKDGKQQRKSKVNRKKLWTAIAIVLLCAGLLWFGFSMYGKWQMSKVPSLSFQEALAYTTKDNPDAVITVGIIKDGQASYTVYGENGKELPREPHTYEIGSLTKTFTAAMIGRAAREGKISLEASVSQYLALPEGRQYPTIEGLLTHTSGCKGYYFAGPMAANFLTGRNSFLGVTKDMVAAQAGKLDLPAGSCPFNYSNYGYALLGLILEAVEESDYTTLLNQFAQDDLGLSNTRISNQSGDLGKYWDWAPGDAYIPAGAVTSDINDMLVYAQMQLDESPYFAGCHDSLEVVNATPEQYRQLGIRVDEIGMAWIIDRENGIIWHDGGTGDYNSYLGFSPETGTAVVILSNLPPRYRIPATVLGVKLLAEMENQSYERTMQ